MEGFIGEEGFIRRKQGAYRVTLLCIKIIVVDTVRVPQSIGSEGGLRNAIRLLTTGVTRLELV